MNKLIIPLLFVMGCIDPTTTDTISADGSRCKMITCGDLTSSECVVYKGKACSNGYDVVEQGNYGSYYLLKCHPDKF